jgi:Peptidase family M28
MKADKQEEKPADYNNKSDIKSIIIVLDQNFGMLRFVQQDDSSNRLAGIDIMPYMSQALSQFDESKIQVILLVQERIAFNSLQDLKQFVPSIKEVISIEQDLQNTLSTLAERYSVSAEQTVFVAADRFLRGRAADKGYLALPHPTIAALAIRRIPLYFVRVIGDRKQFERIQEIVPYYLERSEHDQWTLLAVMSDTAINQVIAMRLSIERLPLDISTEDPLFVQLDKIDKQTPEKLINQKVLFSDGRRMLFAMASSVSNDSIPFHDKHGHFLSLMPDPTLLAPISDSSSLSRKMELTLSRWPLQKTKIIRLPLDQTSLREIAPGVRPSESSSFQDDVYRYSGLSNLDTSGPIKSRHIDHPDNSRAVQALLKDLQSMGYTPYTHTFTYFGLVLQNVIADLPGTGYSRLEPNLSEQIRKIFLKYPLPNPPEPWIDEITQLVGKEWLEQQNLNKLSPLKLRAELEEIFNLKASPWWLKDLTLAGLEAQIIIVGCHMDSTASNNRGYNPRIHEAPGADDDASGMAGTLAVAKYLSHFRGKLKNTVRFCFFNAEEHGLIGSKSFAMMMKAMYVPIKAVVCMDMIGYNNDPRKLFEIHAGYTEPTIRDISIPIADLVAAWANNLGSLAPSQIYKGTKQGGSEDTDRDLFDGAINRSDHAAFHQYGYPAVVVTEDFFVNYVNEPTSDSNPNYHQFADKVIDSAFGADITCAVALAVKELAEK